MSNSPRRDRKLNQIGKIGFGILIILGVTLLCISWKALAGPKQEPIKESTAALEQAHIETHKNSAQKKEQKNLLKSGRSFI